MSEEKKKSRLNLNLVMILAIASVIVAIPFAYSSVEPSIIIEMEDSQTTDPFTIEDDNDNVVTAIDPYGCLNGVCTIHFSDVAERTFDTGTQSSTEECDHDILAIWEITYDPLSVDDSNDFPEVRLYDASIEAIIKSETGSNSPSNNNVGVFLRESEDECASPSSSIISASTSNDIFDVREGTTNNFQDLCDSRADVNDKCWIFLTRGGTSITNGTLTYKSFAMTASVTLPAGATMERIQ